MRTCLFCDNTSLTLEHVWPEWISRYLYGVPQKGRFTATKFEGPDRMPTGTPFKASELNLKTRFVCSHCNNNWMSEVETQAKPVLQPLLRGRSVILDPHDQVTLRAWIVLRAMVLERVGAPKTAVPFYTDQERRAFADIECDNSLMPLDGMYIWTFQYQSQQWAARSNVANARIHMVPTGPPTHRIQIVTGFVGRFGFQVLVGRWPKRRRLEFDSHAVRDWETATALLWPHTSDVIKWPPGGVYLGDDTYNAFLDRFSRPGFPLQLRGEWHK